MDKHIFLHKETTFCAIFSLFNLMKSKVVELHLGPLFGLFHRKNILSLKH